MSFITFPADFILGSIHGGSSDDYTPFPTRIFALLFLLANSPRPLVHLLLHVCVIALCMLFVVEYKGNLGLGHVVLLQSTLVHRIYFIHVHMHIHAGEEEYLIHMVHLEELHSHHSGTFCGNKF